MKKPTCRIIWKVIVNDMDVDSVSEYLFEGEKDARKEFDSARTEFKKDYMDDITAQQSFGDTAHDLLIGDQIDDEDQFYYVDAFRVTIEECHVQERTGGDT